MKLTKQEQETANTLREVHEAVNKVKAMNADKRNKEEAEVKHEHNHDHDLGHNHKHTDEPTQYNIEPIGLGFNVDEDHTPAKILPAAHNFNRKMEDALNSTAEMLLARGVDEMDTAMTVTKLVTELAGAMENQLKNYLMHMLQEKLENN